MIQLEDIVLHSFPEGFVFLSVEGHKKLIDQIKELERWWGQEVVLFPDVLTPVERRKELQSRVEQLEQETRDLKTQLHAARTDPMAMWFDTEGKRIAAIQEIILLKNKLRVEGLSVALLERANAAQKQILDKIQDSLKGKPE